LLCAASAGRHATSGPCCPHREAAGQNENLCDTSTHRVKGRAATRSGQEKRDP
jgi:hypothetical protein